MLHFGILRDVYYDCSTVINEIKENGDHVQ